VTDRAGEGQVDHRIPLAEGGTDDASNLQWLCVDCHRQKTEREKARRA
jgi:5-methylcytosine-specific restriction protein A